MQDFNTGTTPGLSLPLGGRGLQMKNGPAGDFSDGYRRGLEVVLHYLLQP